MKAEILLTRWIRGLYVMCHDFTVALKCTGLFCLFKNKTDGKAVNISGFCLNKKLLWGWLMSSLAKCSPHCCEQTCLINSTSLVKLKTRISRFCEAFGQLNTFNIQEALAIHRRTLQKKRWNTFFLVWLDHMGSLSKFRNLLNVELVLPWLDRFYQYTIWVVLVFLSRALPIGSKAADKYQHRMFTIQKISTMAEFDKNYVYTR